MGDNQRVREPKRKIPCAARKTRYGQRNKINKYRKKKECLDEFMTCILVPFPWSQGIQVSGSWRPTGCHGLLGAPGGKLTLTVQIWKQMGWVPMRTQQVMASRMKGSTVWDVSRERGCEGGREAVFSQLPPHCCGSCHFLNRETPKVPPALH